MIETVLVIVFAVITLYQLILAFVHHLFGRNRVHHHNFLLGSQESVANMLETFSRVYQPINLKVRPSIDLPAKYYRDEGLVAINKDFAYQRDSYSTLHTLFEVAKFVRNSWLDEMQKWQKLLFLAQILLALLAVLHPFFLYVATGIAVLGLIVSVYTELHIASLNEYCIEIATDILNLDDYELYDAQKMMEKFSYHGYVYPIELLVDGITFIGIR